MKSFHLGLMALLLVLCSCGKVQDKQQNEENATTIQDSAQVKKKKINKKNLVVKEWNTNVATNTKVLDHVTSYNADGLKIEEIENNSEGQKWRERYEYDANGKKIRELVYDAHNQLVQVKKYEYNEYGKKKITYTYNAKGKLVAIKNYEYLTQE